MTTCRQPFGKLETSQGLIDREDDVEKDANGNRQEDVEDVNKEKERKGLKTKGGIVL